MEVISWSSHFKNVIVIAKEDNYSGTILKEAMEV